MENKIVQKQLISDHPENNNLCYIWTRAGPERNDGHQRYICGGCRRLKDKKQVESARRLPARNAVNGVFTNEASFPHFCQPKNKSDLQGGSENQQTAPVQATPRQQNQEESGSRRNPPPQQRRDFRQQRWQQNRDRAKHFRSSRIKERMDHCGIPMTGQVSDCLICCQRSDLFGLGECLHPICMECTLRIRIIGDAKQCPQCRAEIPTLHFMSAPPGQKLIMRLPTAFIQHPEHEQKFGVRFESQYSLDCFDAYMANRCRECDKMSLRVEFSTFAELRSHMSQEHQLSFCRICCDNLNVLIKDRRAYTREALQLHMNGKLQHEEEGFRGHPTCHFCEERFYDDEQQYRHLRKEHYFCQFCHQEGLESNVFYRNQHQLNQHNRRHHHPCLDNECLQMGIVFLTDVELNVHKAKQHRFSQNGNGGRSGNFPLDIQFVHSRGGVGTSRQGEGGENGQTNQQQQQPEQRQSSSQFVRIVPSAQSRQQPVRIVRSSVANPLQATSEFPSLTSTSTKTTTSANIIPTPLAEVPYGAPPGWSSFSSFSSAQQQAIIVEQQRQKAEPRRAPPPLPLTSNEQFPTLGGGGGSSGSAAATAANVSNSTKQQSGAAATTVWGQKSNKELFAPRVENEAMKKKEEERKRQKFVASPDCWPEHMLEKLKAREQGLPDPEPIAPPHWLNPPKKEKKRKTKTVPASVAMSRLVASEAFELAPSSSKFNALAAYVEANEETGTVGKMNWWSAGLAKTKQPKPAQVDDNTVDLVPIFVAGGGQSFSSSTTFERRRPPPPSIPPPQTNIDQKENELSLEPPPGFSAPAHIAQPRSTDDGGCMKAEKEICETQSQSHSSSLLHMTMSSIASALFGGEAGAEERPQRAEGIPKS